MSFVQFMINCFRDEKKVIKKNTQRLFFTRKNDMRINLKKRTVATCK